ncbi:GntR family transcriptional regulator [Enterococcus faecium]|nr:GntR family transcriptional regulator [Enterococcus faecium]
MKKREFIIQDLLSKIYQKEFINGKLPTQRKLAEMYGVSRFTIQQTVNDLAEIGIVRVVQGSGIFIHEKWVKNPMIFNSLTKTPYNRIRSKMLQLSKSPATMDEQKIFQINALEEVWTFERVRIVDYKIEQLEISKLPVKLFPNLSQEIVEHSIQKYVENQGYLISHYITSYAPVTISREQAEILSCKKGTPAMQITNRGILENGQVFEYSNILAIDYAVTYIRPFDRENHRSRID